MSQQFATVRAAQCEPHGESLAGLEDVIDLEVQVRQCGSQQSDQVANSALSITRPGLRQIMSNKPGADQLRRNARKIVRVDRVNQAPQRGHTDRKSVV